MGNVTIRGASQGDLAGVLALYHHLNPHDPMPEPMKAQAAWGAIVGSGLITVFVADSDGSLTASCMLIVSPNLTRGARPFAVIENVVTDPNHRSLGLGRMVLTAAIEAAWRADCYKVMLASGRDDGTLRFYERCGFRRGGKTFFEVRRP
jgi:GNAT superfamily N-acetyltransferase